MGNVCNFDTTVHTSGSGALLSMPANLFDFSYGEDPLQPLVEHTFVPSIFNDTSFRERLMPIL